MGRKRTWTDIQLIEAVATSTGVAQVLPKLGLAPIGGNHATVANRIRDLGLDISHFKSRAEQMSHTRSFLANELTSEEVQALFCKGRRFDTIHRKYARKLLSPLCSECGLGPSWNSRPLVLQVDHMDGDVTNNELDNLRLLCPNCHTQTSNFAGKNQGSYKRRVVERQTHCAQNAMTRKGHEGSNPSTPTKKIKPRPCKIQWPDPESLHLLLWSLPTTTVASKLGVSDKAIEKHCIKFGISKPPRGYWAKNKG